MNILIGFQYYIFMPLSGILTAVALLLSLLRLRGACGFSAEKALRCKFFPLQTEAIRLYYGRKNLNRSNFYD